MGANEAVGVYTTQTWGISQKRASHAAVMDKLGQKPEKMQMFCCISCGCGDKTTYEIGFKSKSFIVT